MCTFYKRKTTKKVINVCVNNFLLFLQRFCYTERHESDQPKWELLTSHVARRTFVVNALSLGISAEVIMKWTGHSDYESMKPYIAIVDDLKAGEMSKFNRH